MCKSILRNGSARERDTHAQGTPRTDTSVRAGLRYLAAHPDASYRHMADAVGIKSRTQISALLSRLMRAGLLEKRPGRPGIQARGR